ncbi:MAG: hypothetical protein JRN33_04135 [Nitrososphaerota archaeon]|nr:hypothetical protein [Nitrososphaerota archaeon]
MMTFNRAIPVAVEYEVRRMCKLTPDGSQIELVEFSDNPNDERMFHGEHSFIYVDSSSGEPRLRRHSFLDSEDRGFFVTEEEVEVAGDGTSAILKSVDEGGKNPIHQGTVQRVSDSELKAKGKIIMGSRVDPYEIRLVPRKAK